MIPDTLPSFPYEPTHKSQQQSHFRTLNERISNCHERGHRVNRRVMLRRMFLCISCIKGIETERGIQSRAIQHYWWPSITYTQKPIIIDILIYRNSFRIPFIFSGYSLQSLVSPYLSQANCAINSKLQQLLLIITIISNDYWCSSQNANNTLRACSQRVSELLRRSLARIHFKLTCLIEGDLEGGTAPLLWEKTTDPDYFQIMRVGGLRKI